MKKAYELTVGDKITAEQWSNLWNRMEATTCTVMSVTKIGENFSIMAKAKDGFQEYVTDLFATANTEYAIA